MGPVSNSGFRPVLNPISSGRKSAGKTIDQKPGGFQVPLAGNPATQSMPPFQPAQPIQVGHSAPIQPSPLFHPDS